MLMSAQMVTGTNKIERRMIPVPHVAAHELLVRVLASGVCGSDLAAFRGTHPYKRPPVVLGHELVGTVERVGADVATVRPGDLVSSLSYSPCDVCLHCRLGAANRCANRSNLGHLDWTGSFAEFVLLRENMTLRIPRTTIPEMGALVEPLSIAVHAIRIARPRSTDRLAVLGAGSIGLACLVAARQFHVLAAVAIDVGDGKHKVAQALGADGYVNADALGSAADLPRAVATVLDGPADITVVASGHPGAIDQAAAMTASGGRVVVVSYFPSTHSVDLNLLVGRELSVLFSALSTRTDAGQVIGWLRRGEVDLTPLVSHRYPLDRLGDALRLFASGAAVGKIMVFPVDWSKIGIPVMVTAR